MKKIISFVLVGLSILLFSCGGSKSSSVVSKYLKAESASDYETAYSLLSSSDRSVKSLAEYKEQESSEFGLLFTEAVRKSTTFKVNDSSENGDSAIVKVEITQDDYSAAVSEMFGAAFSGASKYDLAKKAENLKGNASKKTTEKTYNLIKENGQWVIFFDWEKEIKIKKLKEEAKKLEQDGILENLVSKYDEILALDSSNNEILAKKNAVVEKINYFSKVAVYDFVAKYYEQYFGGKEAGVVFKVKNNGNKELKRVQLTVYFKDNSGNIIHEDKFTPVSEYSWNSNNKPLKPNRIWQMDSGYYLKADNVPSEWKEGYADVKITDIDFN